MIQGKEGFRRRVLAGLLLLLLTYAYFAGHQHEHSADKAQLAQHYRDLYSVFRDEIRADVRNNVYQDLGNRLQLEGAAYLSVWRALNAYDLMGVTERSPMPAADRRALLKQRLDAVDRTFAEVLGALPWPVYKVMLNASGIESTVPDSVTLLEGISQPVLFKIQNQSGETRDLDLSSSEGLALDLTHLQFVPGGLRYVLGWITPSRGNTWQFSVAISEQDKPLGQVRAGGTIGPTVLLEGELVAAADDPEPPIARVRVMDTGGRHYPVERPPSGLVVGLIPLREKAERWAYADRFFRVRVPPGRIKISIRRGLEYSNIDQELVAPSKQIVQRQFKLQRWMNMEQQGWFSADTHFHLLDPVTALFELRAENLNVGNILVFNNLGKTYSTEHFAGKVDPASDNRHLIYYNQEYRNEPLGHVSFLNLKQIITPLSTGRLGIARPNFLRYSFYSEPLPLHGDRTSPDFPLLLEAMREARRQGALVNWAHLRTSQWEFPLDATFGQVDAVDILTHTNLTQDLPLWYALLNCNFRIPASAGTDRVGPLEPIGHQRVYVKLEQPFTYEAWIAGLGRGSSFVTNGPMVHLDVEGVGPGGKIEVDEPRRVRVHATAQSQLPFERLEILVNGKVVETADATAGGTLASISWMWSIDRSAWVAARCVGAHHPELFYSHPVFAHTNPVYVTYRGSRLEEPESASLLLGYLKKLLGWAESEAFFVDSSQRQKVIETIRQAMERYQKIAEPGRPQPGL